MNKEIKEILDNIKRQNEWEGIEYFKTPLSTEQANKLLDYITNLQKTQETLIKNDNEIITNLQEENERLKELCDKYEEEHSTAFNLWTMKMKEMPDYAELQDYKSRCEKAISKIKLLGKYDGECCTRNFKMMSADFNDLLNILKGSEVNE